MLKTILAIFTVLILSANSYASAPMVKTQAPGFYRFMLGDFEVTAISDGTVVLPMNNLLTNIKKERLEKDLKNAFFAGPFETSVNAYLINTGSKLVLIDTGAAGLFGPTLGKLLINLTAAGYSAEQIDEVYITHLHNDHIGGILRDGKKSFPNAIVKVDQNDVDFWLSKENMDKAPQDMKGFFQGPMDSLAPYIKD
ncbi:MAG: MBL fold metallo-hydrolase, partial [Bdellovibrionales bacterium]|nr:MBL fold metallo-hydrolase [Bdellovibrionales bacterium]